ncbi:MAG: SDR family NAD(P)-dependent oxidoreductase [Acidimicrobiia bacterium]
MDVRDKVCVVTGGAGGIGKALGEAFVAGDARGVVLVDLDADVTEAAAVEVGAVGFSCDATDEHALASLVERVEDEIGPIDIFCSNAGFSIDGGLEVPDEGWQSLWDLHVLAHVYAARAVLPSMLSRGSGYLVQTVSAAGLLASLTSLPYTVTKHASLALAEWLSITHRDRGIRVSAVCPLVVDTPLSGRFTLDMAGEMASPADVAAAVIDGIREERFLVLPQPEVAKYVAMKYEDTERWLGGMARLWSRVTEGPGPELAG